VTATGGAGTIAVTLTAPGLPTDWTITQAIAWAMVDGDAQTDASPSSWTQTDDSTPWAPAFADLTAGDYIVMAWFKYTKADGSIAYGPSTTVTATVS
jgi:hypothetical protein